MEKKIFLKIMLIIIILISMNITIVKAESEDNTETIEENIINSEDNVNNIVNEKNNDNIEKNNYKYNQNDFIISYRYNKNNTVTVIVKSEIEFKKTKPTWNLSGDNKEYIKEFDKNQRYTTAFTLKNGKTIDIEINITQVKDMQLTVIYEYDEDNNIEIAKIISNVPMKNTKPTWKLSSDKKIYIKEFDKNQRYTTVFTQNNGKDVKFEINITQIKDMQLTTTYEYDADRNIEIAKVTSNYPMSETKPTWKLSSDKKTYTKEFNKNERYTTVFTQNNGKIVELELNITQIKEMILTVNYDYYNSNTRVKVSVTSNLRMQDTKPTWKLSSDKKTYTKIFDTNENYSTDFTQINGISKKLHININKIRELHISIQYNYSQNKRNVTVIVTSNFKFKDTKPTWTLSSDKKIYTKSFNNNTNYYTKFTDEYDREREINININEIVKDPILLSDVTLSSPSSGADRNINLSIASNTINGIVLNPGDLFVWSQVVGPATYAKGYKNAAVFQGNKITMGVGGGICQVSSTLYQAVRNIGLEIIERHQHSLPTSYTTLGNDATVSYGALDFIFRNNKSYSILIKMNSYMGNVNCKLYQI